MLLQRRSTHVSNGRVAQGFLHLSLRANKSYRELRCATGRHQHKLYSEHIRLLQRLRLSRDRLRVQ